MKKRSLGLLVLLLAAALLLMPACGSSGGGGGSTKTLVGTWTVTQASNPGSVGMIIIFAADGTGNWGGTPLVYSYSGSTITLIVGGSVYNYTLAWLTDVKIQITNTSSGAWLIMVK